MIEAPCAVRARVRNAHTLTADPNLWDNTGMPRTIDPTPVRIRRIARGYTGLYVDGTIYVDPSIAHDATALAAILRHERTHARQHRESGLSWDAWRAEYQRQLATHGYLNHPWEIEARKAERLTA